MGDRDEGLVLDDAAAAAVRAWQTAEDAVSGAGPFDFAATATADRCRGDMLRALRSAPVRTVAEVREEGAAAAEARATDLRNRLATALDERDEARAACREAIDRLSIGGWVDPTAVVATLAAALEPDSEALPPRVPAVHTWSDERHHVEVAEAVAAALAPTDAAGRERLLVAGAKAIWADDVVADQTRMRDERDAALARVAELRGELSRSGDAWERIRGWTKAAGLTDWGALNRWIPESRMWREDYDTLRAERAAAVAQLDAALPVLRAAMQLVPGPVAFASAAMIYAQANELRRDHPDLAALIEGEPAPDTEPAAPVCSRCNDTHQMTLDDRVVMCTGCPLPCVKCREGGRGPYCETTPCPCACHREVPRG